jgi:hypothetical protein
MATVALGPRLSAAAALSRFQPEHSVLSSMDGHGGGSSVGCVKLRRMAESYSGPFEFDLLRP